MLQHLEIIIWPGFGAETWQGNTLVLRPDKAIPFVGSVDSWTDMTNEFPMVSIFGQCQPQALPVGKVGEGVNSCLFAGSSTIDLTHSPNDSWVAMQRVGGFECLLNQENHCFPERITFVILTLHTLGSCYRSFSTPLPMQSTLLWVFTLNEACSETNFHSICKSVGMWEVQCFVYFPGAWHIDKCCLWSSGEAAGCFLVRRSWSALIITYL